MASPNQSPNRPMAKDPKTIAKLFEQIVNDKSDVWASEPYAAGEPSDASAANAADEASGSSAAATASAVGAATKWEDNKYMKPAVRFFLDNPNLAHENTASEVLSQSLAVLVYGSKTPTEEEAKALAMGSLYIHTFFSKYKIWDLPVSKGVWQKQRYDIEYVDTPEDLVAKPVRTLVDDEEDIFDAFKRYFVGDDIEVS